ncbi:hypothetical protein TrCOL_g3068 [Triparma columacea]|uniref:DoxX family protein n=1 Tax=Triparma columacea TaxID=722753 RepID=A0A9W7GKE0_9STRA|nr:hypothetical protein TrCOL_g3068 [Triparma columacea]
MRKVNILILLISTVALLCVNVAGFGLPELASMQVSTSACASPRSKLASMKVSTSACTSARSKYGKLYLAPMDTEEIGVGKKKETTLDRIFGPKLFKTVTSTAGIHSVPLFILRVTTGVLMIHHGSEGGVGPGNFGTDAFNGFTDFIVQPYFGFLPGPATLWSAVHDYVEFFGGGLFALGLLTRPAALSLLSTMIGAVYFHLSSTGPQGAPFGHVPNYSYDFEEPLLYACIFLLYWFNGAGGPGVDNIVYDKIKKED